MPESNLPKSEELASPAPASSPDDLIKDLSVEISEADQNAVTGGKAGQEKPDYLILKFTDVIISNV